jgi:hypothetical protein
MAKNRPIIQPFAVRAEDAAAMLGISTSYLAELVKEGRIRPPYRIAQRVLLFDVERLREDWDKLKSAAASADAPNPWDEVLV